MSEVAHPGKDHRHAVLIGSRDHLFIANRAARLDDSSKYDPLRRGEINFGHFN